MRIKLLLSIITISVLLAGCEGSKSEREKGTATTQEPNPDLIIDVRSLAAKTKNEVNQTLGDPIACEKGKRGEICYFEHPLIQVQFIQDKSERIVVSNMSSVNFTSTATVALGLPKAQPDFSNEYVMRWNDQFGFREISLFSGGSKVDYAYIKVSTD